MPEHQQPPKRPRTRRPGRLRRILLGTLLVLCSAIGIGISGSDVASLHAFTESVDRWQVNPDFRTIATDYSILGSEAMRTTPFGIKAAEAIMAIRSIPGLPKEYAVCDTSRPHYENFSAGPLSAYLFLSDEQDVVGHIKAVQQLGAKPPAELDDDAYKAWLEERQMDFPICRDAGAVRSVAGLVGDVEPAKTFTLRDEIAAKKLHMSTLLAPHIAAIATELKFPTTPKAMTPEQQHVVLTRLDGHLRRLPELHPERYELWRVKQVSDFAAGIWAQVYGPPYNGLLVPAVMVHTAARWTLVAVLAWLAFRSIRRRPDPAEQNTEGSADDDDDALAAPQPSAAI